MIIWLASFPRSGNTFFRVLLKHYYGLKTYSLYADDAYLVKNLGFHDNDGDNPLPMDLSEMASSEEIFFVKTHDLPADDNPAIYLVRDGRDTLISYAHYVLSFEKNNIIEGNTPEKAFYKTLHDLIAFNASFGGWGPNVLTWAKRKSPTVVIRFEELVNSKTPITIVQNALATLGFSDRLPLHKNAPPSFEDLHQKMPTFFREGKVGGWQEKMPPELLDLFWKTQGDAMVFMEYVQEIPVSNIQANAQENLSNYVFELRKKDLELQEKENFIQAQHKELIEKDAALHEKTIDLHEKDAELAARETIIQQFRESRRYWLLNGPFRHSPLLSRLLATVFNMHARFAPKLGVYHQYPPRPLNLPQWYRKQPRLADADLPMISIVTPSYNQAVFLERTIQSVLSQEYPKLEYVIQDGNSTDGSADILEKYRAQLKHAESVPDGGQGNAINLGMRHVTGGIMAYLNSDDMFLPGTLHYVARYFAAHPHVDVVYGHRVIVDENDQEVGVWVMPPHDRKVLGWADYVPQETMFWRREIWEKSGGKMDESFQFALDWDLLLRFQQAGAKIVRLPRFLAAFRVHGAQKSTAQINERGVKEMNLIRQRMQGREVSWMEINAGVRPYLTRSVMYHKLYRLGVLRY